MPSTPVSQEPHVTDSERPPVVQVGWVGWLRRNLFSSWMNSLLTVLAVLLLLQVIPPLLDWFVIQANIRRRVRRNAA